MRVGIIGGGSIGLLFAFYLSERQHVCLYVRTKEQMELIKAKGLILVRDDEERQRWLDVKLCSEWRGLEDATLIAVKQYQLNHIMDMLYEYGSADHALLFLQNGMGHLKWLDKLRGNIYVGTVEHGAMRTSPNRVCHTGLGSTKISPYRQSTAHFIDWIQSETDEKFSFTIEEEYESMLLKKLVVNAVINPLTAILRVKNGEIIENPNYFQLVQLLFTEIVQSLQLQDGNMYFENLLFVCAKTAKNQSSMLRDVEENRPTEVDAILGYILEKAAVRRINTPVIKAFYYAVKGKECKVEE